MIKKNRTLKFKAKFPKIKKRTFKISVLVIFLSCLSVGVYFIRYKADIVSDLTNLDKVHTVLTDGKKATSLLDSDAWVNFTKDANDLGTREKLAADQLSPYGIASIHQGDDLGDLISLPDTRKSLYEANIRTLKYPFSAGTIESSSNEYELKQGQYDEIDDLYNDGFNFIGDVHLGGIIDPKLKERFLGYRQGYNVLSLPYIDENDGQLGESLNFPSNTAKLSKIDENHPLLTKKQYNNQNNLHLVDPAIPLQSYSETLPISDTRCCFLQHIIKPGAEKVYISLEGSDTNFIQINRYDPTTLEDGKIYYELVNENEVTLPRVRFQGTPAKLKIEYQGWDSENSLYLKDIDYSVDVLSGIITKENNSFSTPYINDKFDGTALDSSWKTMNNPQNISVSNGKLSYNGTQTANFGENIYQELNGNGNFIASIKRTDYAPHLTVYQDNLNWVSYNGKSLTQMVNGVVNYSEISTFEHYNKPNWINVKKVGDSYTFYGGDENNARIDNDVFYFSSTRAFIGNGYANKASITDQTAKIQLLNAANLKVGISGTNYPTDIVVEEFVLRPGLTLSTAVEAYYNYFYYDKFNKYAKDLASKYKDIIYYWEITGLPYTTARGGYEMSTFKQNDSYWLGDYAIASSSIANKFRDSIKLGNGDAKIIGNFSEYPPALQAAYYGLAKTRGWQQFDINYEQAISNYAYSFYAGSSTVVDFNTIFKPFIDNDNVLSGYGFEKKPYIDTKYGVGNTFARLYSDYQGLSDQHTQNVMFGKKVNSISNIINEITWDIFEHPLLSCAKYSKRKVNLERRNNKVVMTGYEDGFTCGDFTTNLSKGERIVLSEASDESFNGEFVLTESGAREWDPKTYEQEGNDADAVAYVENPAKEASLLSVAKNIGKNKGIILDLGDRVDYIFGTDPDPAKTKKSVKKIQISAKNISNISKIKVKSSLTNTDNNLDNSGGSLMQFTRPAKPGDSTGVFSLPNFPVYFDATSPNFKEESILLTGISKTQYKVEGTLSGDQGTATQGVPFVSNNGVISMTIPTPDKWGAPDIDVGDTLWAHLFKGDGYKDVTEWNNSGQSGLGNIVIELPEAIETRYLQFEFYKSDGADSFSLDEIEVFDGAGSNISTNKLYLAEGAISQPSLFSSDNAVPEIIMISPSEKGGVIQGPISSTELRYSVDGIEKTKSIRVAKGNNKYTLKARDKAGNTSEKVIEFFVSSLPPIEVNIIAPIEGGTVYRDKIKILYSADGELKQKDATLVLGSNKIEVEEKNAEGYVTKKEVNVNYEAPAQAPLVENEYPVNNSTLYISQEESDYVANILYEVDGFTVLLKDQKLKIGENLIPITETNSIGTTSFNLKYNVVQLSTPTIYIESPVDNFRTKEDSIEVVYYVDGARYLKTFGLNYGDNRLTVYGYNRFYSVSASINVGRDETIVPPSQSFASGWNMVTFPMIDESSLGSILPSTFKVRRFNSSSNKYDKAEEVEVKPIPGQGYWMKIDDIAKIDSVKYKSTSATSTSVPVAKGWNLLGNPFLSDLQIANLNIRYKNGSVKSFADAVKSKDIAGYAWSWEGTANPKQYYFISNDPNRYKTSAHKQTFISSYRGFWIVIKKDEVAEVIINQ